MKTQLSNLLTPISHAAGSHGTIEVKETIAFNHNGQSKTFSAAELWSIQRRHRTINPVRRFIY